MTGPVGPWDRARGTMGPGPWDRDMPKGGKDARRREVEIEREREREREREGKHKRKLWPR